jgi:hypothetical protein
MPDPTTPAGRDELLRKIGWCKQLGIESIDEVPVADLLALLDQADERDKLQAFKAWVHTYLDAKGIPHHPPGPHGAEGCRIGDRMDYVFAKIADAGERRAAEVAELEATAARRLELLRELRDSFCAAAKLPCREPNVKIIREMGHYLRLLDRVDAEISAAAEVAAGEKAE